MRFIRLKYADGDRLEIAGLSVRLKVSQRARRISIRVDRVRGELVAVAPSARRLAEAAQFARDRSDWAAQRLAELPQRQALQAGAMISLLGEPCRLEPGPGPARLVPAAGADPVRLVGCGREAVEPVSVIRIVRREALGAFQARAAAHCAALGVAAPPVSLSDGRSRWGSCTPAQRGRAASIRLSWRLALAPFEVADYVVAHECAHLIEANHSARFWAHVRRLVGDHRRHRSWLRAHGDALHAFGR